MSQVQIKVLLTSLNGTDVMIFYVNDDKYPDGIQVNMNSSDGQNDLKKVFSALLERTIESELILVLEIPSEYTKGLYREVCTEYVNDLNGELKIVCDRIRSELK